MNTCKFCGCLEDGETSIHPIMFLYGDEYACEDCAPEHGLGLCLDCEEWVSAEDLVNVDGDVVCEDCAHDRGYETCEECGEWVEESCLTAVNTRYGHDVVCEDCLDRMQARNKVFWCDCCDEYFLERDYTSYALHDGGYVCEGCFDDHYGTCDDCGHIFHSDDLEWDEDSEHSYCIRCYSDLRASHKIKSYSFKPAANFLGIDHTPGFGDPLTFGLELEVDNGSNRRDCAEEIGREFDDDWLYMKEDGSVDFEIVTHPATLDYHIHEFGWDKLCAIPPKYGYKSHDAGTCGLHIHVGRRQLADNNDARREVIAKINLIMWRHWNALVKFSRRKEYQLSRWAKEPSMEFRPKAIYPERDIIEEALRVAEGYDRYLALNLRNAATIEFRLWRGSLNPATVLATIELTSNICKYAMKHTLAEVITSTWLDVARFEVFEELDSYLADRGLIEDGGETREIPEPTPEVSDPRLTHLPHGGFRIGDHVTITGSSRNDIVRVNEEMFGLTGTIAGFNQECGEEVAAVHIDLSETTSGLIARHAHRCYTAESGRALCPDGGGYFVHPVDLALTEDSAQDVQQGDVVELTDPSFGPDWRNTRGFAVAITDTNTSLGICFPHTENGHDLNGRLSHPLAITGWWVARCHLRRVVNI